MKRARMSAASRIAAFDKEDIAREVRGWLTLEQKDPGMHFTAIELEYLDSGIYEDGQIWINYAIDTRHRHMNVYGHVHGGAIATMMDAAMGIGACAASEYYLLPTVDMSMLFHHAVTEGRYRIHMQTTHMGRKMVNCRCGMYNEQGRLCATGMAGYYVKE